MERFTFIIFFSVAVIFCSGQIPVNGLIGAWTFNGNANDASVSANHGTVYNAVPVADRCGNNGSAYSFNGINARIITAKSGVAGAQPRSVAFWLRSTGTTYYSPQVAFDYGNNQGAGDASQVVLNYCSPGIGFDVSDQAFIRPAPCLFDGNWHHVAVVFDPLISGMMGDIQHYIDGIKLQTQVCNVSGTNSVVYTDPVHPITIGSHAYGAGRFFKGELDDFYFYNRVLSHTEILQLMNANPCLLGGPDTLCGPGNAVFIAPQITGATSYSWTLPSGWSGYSTTGTISAGFSQGGQITYSVFGSCGMIASSGKPVTVHPLPAVSASASKTVLCVNLSESTHLFGVGAMNYTWMPGQLIGTPIVVTPTANTTYSVLGKDGNGCSSTGTVHIQTEWCTKVSLKKNSGPINVVVYPNPGKNELSVIVQTKSILQLFNLAGEMVAEAKLDAGVNTVDIRKLPSGFYMLVITESTGSQELLRVVKE